MKYTKTMASLGMIISCGSLHAATVFDFSNTSSSTSANNSTSTGNVFAAEGSAALQVAIIDGIELTIEAVNDNAGSPTVTLGANSQGWGVLSDGESGGAATARRIGGDLATEAFEFSFDTDLTLDSLRFGSMGAGEVVTLEFVSGTNPFTVGSSLTIDGALDPTFDVLLAGMGTVESGTILRLYASTPTGGGVLFNELAVTAIPEPSSTALLGLSGLALILRRRKG